MKKVVIGLSGGVDSSVAAWLLQQQGFEVEGLFMKNWEADDSDLFCPAAQDLADAQAVCQTLQIPLHTVNFSKTYWDRVFATFLDEYAKSRTPNPDVLCNKEIKFRAFLEHAMTEYSADWIATGHYAQVMHHKSHSQLLKARDRSKDQTYFLHAISQTALQKTLFPIGNYLKTDIRAIAKQLHLVTHDKKDSTGICFIGERRFKAFLNEFLLAQPGPIQSESGEVLGTHDGLMFYTIGQRQGLQIGGKKHADPLPWYVVGKVLETNTLLVAQGEHHPLLYATALRCDRVHWLLAPPTFPLVCHAKIRFRQADEPCVMTAAPDSEGYIVTFTSPQRAITPGQYVVFYQQDRCLGGGCIESVVPYSRFLG